MSDKTLIHICCADCGLKLMDQIEGEKALYFYNPNIHPESEWKARKEAVQQVFSEKNLDIIFANWSPKNYFAVVKQSAGRCQFCWRLRLGNTFEYAVANGFDAVSSTLFTSIYHDHKMLRGIALELSEQFGIKTFFPEQVDHCLKTSGFYKQNYCGCIYSLNEKYGQKYSI